MDDDGWSVLLFSHDHGLSMASPSPTELLVLRTDGAEPHLWRFEGDRFADEGPAPFGEGQTFLVTLDGEVFASNDERVWRDAGERWLPASVDSTALDDGVHIGGQLWGLDPRGPTLVSRADGGKTTVEHAVVPSRLNLLAVPENGGPPVWLGGDGLARWTGDTVEVLVPLVEIHWEGLAHGTPALLGWRFRPKSEVDWSGGRLGHISYFVAHLGGDRVTLEDVPGDLRDLVVHDGHTFAIGEGTIAEKRGDTWADVLKVEPDSTPLRYLGEVAGRPWVGDGERRIYTWNGTERLLRTGGGPHGAVQVWGKREADFWAYDGSQLAHWQRGHGVFDGPTERSSKHARLDPDGRRGVLFRDLDHVWRWAPRTGWTSVVEQTLGATPLVRQDGSIWSISYGQPCKVEGDECELHPAPST